MQTAARTRRRTVNDCPACKKLPWGKTGARRCVCHGFNLDLGCGPNKQPGFVGMDKRDIPGVDIVHDIEVLPWPFPDDCVDKLLMSHVLEHMKPWLVLDIMNEMWRVVKKSGQVLIAVPYAGSHGFWTDPTHTKGFTEYSWAYFDPEARASLWGIYQPKPWKVVACHYDPRYNMEVKMEPRK